MAKILVVDDEQVLIKGIKFNLEREGYQVESGCDGEQAVELAREGSFDLILMDLMMPKIDGYEVCRKIRAKSNVPVILVTARGEDFERIMGLDIGADDYIVKPFSPSEVMARVRAVMRRMSTASKGEQTEKDGNVIRVGSMVINLEEYSLFISGTRITLTNKELETMWT